MNNDGMDESVLVSNFRNEMAEILSIIRELKCRKYGEIDKDDDSGQDCEIGCFGLSSHRLQRLNRQLREQLSFSSAVELLVLFGDALIHTQEYTASKSYYHDALESFEGPTTTKRSLQDQEMYVRAAFGHALSRVRLLKATDPTVLYPSTLGQLVSILHSMEATLRLATTLALDPKVQNDGALHSKCVAHVLNGTVHLMGVCTPMKALGFEANVLPFLKFAILVLDNIIQLCTVKYCLWRTQIYVAIAECYDEEELDPPVAEGTLRVVAQADDSLQRTRFLVQKFMKAAAAVTHPPAAGTAGTPPQSQLLISLSRDDVQTAFPNSVSRIRTILVSLKTLWKPQWTLNLLHDFEDKAPFLVSATDIDGIITYMSSIVAADPTSVDGLHNCVLKLLFRLRKWTPFMAMYKSRLETTQDSIIDAIEVELLYALYELIEDPADRMRLFKVASGLRLACESREMCALRYDVLVEVMLYLWHVYASPMLESMNKALFGQEKSDAGDAIRLLLALQVSSHALNFDDIVWRANLALHLVNLLNQQHRLRLAIQILRVTQDVLSTVRDAIVNIDLHAVLADSTNGLQQLHHVATKAVPFIANSKDVLPSPGSLRGTTFQQTSLNLTLAAIQTEVGFLLYDMELQCAASVPDGTTMTAVAKRLAVECNQNGYMRGLLSVQLAQRKSKRGEQESLLREALQCFDTIQQQEIDVQGETDVLSPNSLRPLAPLLVSRASTFVTIEILPHNPPRGVQVAYYCAYAKGTGAGTDVSLNNMEYPGTGSLIQPNPRRTLATISGLLPNESYVFAVAAYDKNDQVIEGIGATSCPIITLNPLVLSMCYGILATVLHVFFGAISILIDAEVEKQQASAADAGRHTLLSAVTKAQMTDAIGKCMIALEVACLTGQHEYICTITHKMYQLMVPLLSQVKPGRLLLQPFLQIIPAEKWGDGIYEVYMCASYEILKITADKKEAKVAQQTLKLGQAASTPYSDYVIAPFHAPCKEAAALRDAIFLSRPWSTALDMTNEQRHDGDVDKKKQTPRDDKAPSNQSRIEEALQSSNVSTGKAISELKAHFSSHKSFMAYSCRVVKLGIVHGERNAGDWLKDLRWHSTLAFTPEASQVLKQLGAAHLHVDTPTVDSTTSEEKHGADEPTPFDVSNREVYLWTGEYFYLMGLAQYTGIAPVNSGSPLEGPDHDISWRYFDTHPQPLTELEPPTEVERDPKVDSVLTNVAVASQLFYHARAWANLRACAQTVWNLLWAKWMSPASFKRLYDWRSLYIVSMRLMDMLDVVRNDIAFDDSDVLSRDTNVDGMERFQPTTGTTSSHAEDDDIDIPWVVKFATYTIQVLCTAGEWEHLVLLGKRVYDLTGSDQSEPVLPWVVYAQSQRCDQHDVVVATATDDLAQFIKTFDELQSKKKKKKSRLVVHEVVTEDERVFRDERVLKEKALTGLTEAQATLKSRLALIKTWLDHATRSKNMCLQALQRTQKAVTKQYLCHEKAADVLAGFKSTISLCRQKRATLMLVQALQEQGDFLFAENDIAGATKSWNDGIDAVFGTLATTANWRSIVPQSNLRVDGENLWAILMCCNMLGKLTWICLQDQLNQRLEYALMGSAVFCKLFTCSLQHPNVDNLHTFSSFSIYPAFTSMAHKPLRQVQPASLLLMSTTMIETLLTNGKHAQALPLACAMEYFASRHFHDAQGVMQAKRMKFDACVGIGHMGQAVVILSDLINHSMSLDESKRIGDPANELLHKWLLEFSVSKIVGDVKLGARFAHLLVLSVLRWMVALGFNEGNASPQGIALKHIANQVASQLQEVHLPQKDKSTPREPESARNVVPPGEKLHPLDQMKISVECALLQSVLALHEGLADTARTLVQNAMKVYRDGSKVPVDDTHFDCVSSDLGALFWLRCRVQWIKCDLMQGHVKDAITLCEVASLEAVNANEAKFQREIAYLRFQALVLEGCRGDAEAIGLEWLANDDAHSPTTTRVEVLLLLSHISKTKALSTPNQAVHLNASATYLMDAMAVMNAITHEHGWIGLHSASSQQALVNVYQPQIALYVTVKAHTVSRLLELYDFHFESTESLGILQAHVEDGLRALDHVPLPDPKLKASLLFFNGCVLRRKNKVSQDCVPPLLEAMQLWLKDGGHPRKLMHRACMELVQVYGETNNMNEDDKARQAQAAFHYLGMACKLQEQLHVLWHTTQLHVVSATGLDKLSAPLQHEILSAAKGLNQPSSTTLDHLGFLVLPYFLSMQRELDIVYDQGLASAMQHTAASVHLFLSQNHMLYSKHCFQSLTSPPKEDPEIPGGLICVQWVKCSSGEVAMYYALGTATNTREAFKRLVEYTVSWTNDQDHGMNDVVTVRNSWLTLSIPIKHVEQST
ncbi:hypothetical protein DYB31_002308 [Aphanomyces astaci]|uniref:Uncharacterized protein n=1 Tax=Aphanomyces astaci TaxID=112090 RepID=A0A397EH12_APHAT|nr:hypothetical protein DYB31_002308 [Aphanomyces astaci]